jgi:hypothetical protein
VLTTTEFVLCSLAVVKVTIEKYQVPGERFESK